MTALLVLTSLVNFVLFYHNDNELLNYKKNVEQLYLELNNQKIDISTKLEFNHEKTLDSAAICYMKKNIVYVNKGKWWDLSKVERLALITHEIGHCHFKLLHTTNKTLMNTNLLTLDINQKFINNFIKSLRKQKISSSHNKNSTRN